MIERVKENCFEFIEGQSTCTATLSSKKFINRIKKLSEQYPDVIKIADENEDGSIVAHFPVKLICINSPREKRVISEEEREVLRERFSRVIKK